MTKLSGGDRASVLSCTMQVGSNPAVQRSWASPRTRWDYSPRAIDLVATLTARSPDSPTALARTPALTSASSN